MSNFRNSRLRNCRFCNKKNFKSILNLGEQYLTGRFPKKNEFIKSYPLSLVECTNCHLYQLENSFKQEELYGDFYGYASSLNPWMVNHLKMKTKLLKKFLKKDDLILDIGSNDATSLLQFGDNFKRVGFDPSANQFIKTYKKNNIILINNFFSAKQYFKYFSQKAKVIFSYAMFYDLERPSEFVRDIEKVLDENGVWNLEQSYLVTMLKKNAFDTICHEHLEYYSFDVIEKILKKNKLRIFDVSLNDANGGSFNLKVCKLHSIIKTKKSVKTFSDKEKAINFSLLVRRFRNNIEKNKLKLLRVIKKYKDDNFKIYCLGASTKGNVLLQYYGLDNSIVDAVGEVNKKKFGSFTPGTNIKIVNEDKLLKEDNAIYIILPWHFKIFFKSNNKFKNKILIFPLPNIEIYKS